MGDDVEHRAVITNIQKFSVHDGPGIRSIVFFKGCPLRCRWCANPENLAPQPQLMIHAMKCIHCGRCIDRCKQGAIAARDGELITLREKCTDCGTCAAACVSGARVLQGQWKTTEEVEQVIDRDLPFYQNSGGGVTFSGGEPLLHPDFIVEIARHYRQKGLNAAVETCGQVPWENIETVQPWVDLFLYDLKCMDSSRHRRFCGCGNEQILSNLRALCQSSRVIVRIPIIPGFNDAEEDIAAAAAFLKELPGGMEGVHCLPYHNYGRSKYEALGMEYPLPDTALPKGDFMDRIKALFALHGLEIQIGG